jgi:predicted DNA-binding transcriptional regulator AlpA
VQELIERLDKIEEALRAPSREYLDTPAAATFVGMSTDILEAWRVRREGPAYVKLGRVVRYPISALRAFMDAKVVEPLP